MPIRHSLAAVAFASVVSTGCVIVPITVHDYDSECQIITRHMELQAVQVASIQQCGSNSCVMDIMVMAGVAAASAIVSGSIVVVGNIAFWAERRSNCLLAPSVAVPAPQG
ncbi:MAG: hypothetical protein ABJD97_02035 [Betaproteobacteria bacterium]